jgi:hypothetical protein
MRTIHRGSCWRIGNGSKIRIREDNWLPYKKRFKILAHRPAETSVYEVRDLFGAESSSWNQNLVNSLFYNFENIQILQISLTNTNADHQLKSMGTKDGHNTVKSSYHNIKGWENESSQGSTSNNSNDKR